MKKYSNRQYNKMVFQLFLRFLKVNGIYQKYMLAHKNCCKYRDLPSLKLKTDNINDIMKRYNISTIRDLFLHGYVIYWNPSEGDFWHSLDIKWLNFYYKNKIYSKYIK